MTYYVFLDNKVRGPFPLHTVRDNLNSGVFAKDTLCCTSGEDSWVPLSDIFEVSYRPKSRGAATEILNRTKNLIDDLKALPRYVHKPTLPQVPFSAITVPHKPSVPKVIREDRWGLFEYGLVFGIIFLGVLAFYWLAF